MKKENDGEICDHQPRPGSAELFPSLVTLAGNRTDAEGVQVSSASRWGLFRTVSVAAKLSSKGQGTRFARMRFFMHIREQPPF